MRLSDGLHARRTDGKVGKMKDSIVQEVRKARAQLFAKAGHDLATLVKQLQKRQAVSKRRVIKLPHRHAAAA
jgi:hypothetical protein